MKKFHSKDIIHLYDETYFLGGKSKYTGQKIGVEGYQDFANGKMYQKKIDVANLVEFKNKTVLDVGFGRGEVLGYCIEHGAKYAIGLDYSESAFEIAVNHLTYLCPKVKLYLGAVDEISQIKETNIEIVYMMDIIEHVPDAEWEECLNQLIPKLSPDCELIAITPSTKSGGYLEMHNNYMTREKLNNLFCKHFEESNIEDKNNWFYMYCKGLNQ